MKDEVEFADVFKAFVERFDEHLDEVEDAQFGFAGVDAEHKVKGRVVPVDQLAVGATYQPTGEVRSVSRERREISSYN